MGVLENVIGWWWESIEIKIGRWSPTFQTVRNNLLLEIKGRSNNALGGVRMEGITRYVYTIIS